MDAGHIEVSSKVLIDLQLGLKKLSECLLDCYDTVTQNQNKVAEKWEDSKYEEFAEAFKATHDKISEISERYLDWASNKLPPVIETVEKYENEHPDDDGIGGAIGGIGDIVGSTGEMSKSDKFKAATEKLEAAAKQKQAEQVMLELKKGTPNERERPYNSLTEEEMNRLKLLQLSKNRQR